MSDFLAVKVDDLMLYLEGEKHAFRCIQCGSTVFHQVPPRVVAQAESLPAPTHVAYECNGCGAWYRGD